MSADTAARILDAACDLIAEEGIDDVRIAVEGRTRVIGIGGVSHDHSGFGVGPLLEPDNAVERVRRVYETEVAA